MGVEGLCPLSLVGGCWSGQGVSTSSFTSRFTPGHKGRLSLVPCAMQCFVERTAKGLKDP